MTLAQLTGREYKRVSLDKSKRARSVEEQGKDNQAAAEERGIILRDPYADVDRSASRYARKAREGFDALLADLRSGAFDADYLVLWESSRGSRKVAEWCELVDLLERRHIQVLVTSHRKTYDPSVARDRKALLEDALDSAYESDKSSERCRRAHAANAAAGKPHGPVAYGYTRRYDAKTKALLAQEVVEVEAAVVRELFDRLERGHTLTAIANDWRERGIVDRRGKPFRREHLREMALREVYCGVRRHQPKGSLRATITEGTWPAIVTKEQYYAVQRLLSAPERTTNSRPGRARHLLSLIAVCGGVDDAGDVCNGPMTALNRDGDQFYRCQARGCARIREAELDKLATKVMLAWLAQYYAELKVTPDDDTELAAVRARLAAAQDELRELEDEVRAGRLSPRFAAATAPALEARVADLEQRERDLLTPSDLAGLLDPTEDMEAAWDAMPMSACRRVARLLLRPGRVGTLVVMPVSTDRRGGGRHVPARERVRFVP